MRLLLPDGWNAGVEQILERFGLDIAAELERSVSELLERAGDAPA